MEASMFVATEEWKSRYPGACVGVLAMTGTTNPDTHPELRRLKTELEDDLKALFSDKTALREQRQLTAYKQYYKQFKKSYHVLQQLESVIFKGKSIPNVAALVEAMFMAELRDMLLTAGHDLKACNLPLTLDISKGNESFVRMNGQEQVCKEGDMIISDQEAVISSIIYGPDQRTKIQQSTTDVIFTSYGPPGISEIEMMQHLQGIERNVKIFSPEARTDLIEVFTAP
jgi:DNA/RNA-binding domain of Phe-tRNA-synthetase-like protein